MTAEELIAILQTVDPKTKVAVHVNNDGYESYWDASVVLVQELIATEHSGITSYDAKDWGVKAWEEPKPKTTVVTIAPW